MGALGPKIDTGRTIELLKERGVIKAVLTFNGGNDEGWVDGIELTHSSGEVSELAVWYGDGYRFHEGVWQQVTPPHTADQVLSELLQGPIDEQFGSWGGVDYTEGTLTWDVFTGKATLDYHQHVTQAQSFHEEY